MAGWTSRHGSAVKSAHNMDISPGAAYPRHGENSSLTAAVLRVRLRQAARRLAPFRRVGMTALQGTVKGGQIILDTPPSLPDGTRVEVLPISGSRPTLGMSEDDWPTTP